ncbi:MAG: alpha-amylase family glycosyl hydrolase [Phycisphaerales bacterium]
MTRPADAAPWAQSPLADDILYQVMPIAWRDSDHDPADTSPDALARAAADPHRDGDFRGMTAALPYLSTLGVTALWSTPIFPSPAYHGYQHAEPDRVNPALGTESQFLDFNRAAHAANLRVFIDLVAYGINRDSALYRDATTNPASPFAGFIAMKDAAAGSPFGYDYRTCTGARVSFAFLDLRSAGARELVTRWSLKWLDPLGNSDRAAAVDGYRLDHVWARYPDGPDGWGYSITSFWKPWKQALRAARPDVITFAEQARWETYGTDLHPAHDATFAKPFLFAAREAIRTSSAARLHAAVESAIAAILESPATDAPARTLLATLGDHDVDRLASALGATTPRTAPRLKAAAGVLLTQPFPPVIYFGDELGMTGVAAQFGSDANDIPRREPFKWNAVDSFPMTSYLARHADASARRYSKDRDTRSVEEQLNVKGSLLETYRALIKLRRETPALRRGGYRALESSDPRVWACLRATMDQSVLVAVRLSTAATPPGSAPPSITLPSGLTIDRELTDSDVPLSASTPITAGSSAQIELEPGQTRVFLLSRAPDPH